MADKSKRKNAEFAADRFIAAQGEKYQSVMYVTTAQVTGVIRDATNTSIPVAIEVTVDGQSGVQIKIPYGTAVTEGQMVTVQRANDDVISPRWYFVEVLPGNSVFGAALPLTNVTTPTIASCIPRWFVDPTHGNQRALMVKLTWTGNRQTEGVTQYIAEYMWDSDVVWQTFGIKSISTAADGSIPDQVLEQPVVPIADESQSLNFRVKAVTPSGSTNWSAAASVNPWAPNNYPAVTELPIKYDRSGQVGLAWSSTGLYTFGQAQVLTKKALSDPWVVIGSVSGTRPASGSEYYVPLYSHPQLNTTNLSISVQTWYIGVQEIDTDGNMTPVKIFNSGSPITPPIPPQPTVSASVVAGGIQLTIADGSGASWNKNEYAIYWKSPSRGTNYGVPLDFISESSYTVNTASPIHPLAGETFIFGAQPISQEGQWGTPGVSGQVTFPARGTVGTPTVSVRRGMQVGTVTTTWTALPNATDAQAGGVQQDSGFVKYKVYRGTTSSGGTVTWVGYLSPGSEFTWQETSSTQYWFALSAVDDDGNETGKSSYATYVAPAAPALTVTSSQGQVALSWTLPASPPASLVKWSLWKCSTATNTYNDESEIAQLSSNLNTFTYTMPQGTSAYFNIKAVDVLGVRSGYGNSISNPSQWGQGFSYYQNQTNYIRNGCFEHYGSNWTLAADRYPTNPDVLSGPFNTLSNDIYGDIYGLRYSNGTLPVGGLTGPSDLPGSAYARFSNSTFVSQGYNTTMLVQVIEIAAAKQLAPGNSYSASVYVTSDTTGATVTLRLRFLDKSWTVTGSAVTATTPSSITQFAWQRIEAANKVVPANAAYMVIDITTSHASANVLVCGAQVEPYATTNVYQPFVQNTTETHQIQNLITNTWQRNDITGWSNVAKVGGSANTVLVDSGIPAGCPVDPRIAGKCTVIANNPDSFTAIYTISGTFPRGTYVTASLWTYMPASTSGNMGCKIVLLNATGAVSIGSSVHTKNAWGKWMRLTLSVMMPNDYTGLRFDIRAYDTGASGSIFFAGPQFERGNAGTNFKPAFVTKEEASIGARVYNSANLAIANAGTGTFLTFDSERYDSDSIHDTGTGTGRLTCNTAGTYLITGHVAFAASSAGTLRQVAIRLNGTTYIAHNGTAPTGATYSPILSVTTVYQLAVGDYVELNAFQDSGGSLNVLAGGNYSPEFAMQRIV